MSQPLALKFKAFLSYAHSDSEPARQLHRELESFRIDRDLAGRKTERGPVPTSLRPIFRDRDDFAGGHTLTKATMAALDQSAALIVLCSSAAAGRPAVNEEVRLFRWRHPERPVIPVFIEGTYPDNLPPALRFEVTAEGALTDKPTEILGPDLRESGDGPDAGLAKLVAGLIGVGADEVIRRAERAKRRRLWTGMGILAVLAAVLAGAALYANHERQKADTARKNAEYRYELAAAAIINLTILQATLRYVHAVQNKADADFHSILNQSKETDSIFREIVREHDRKRIDCKKKKRLQDLVNTDGRNDLERAIGGEIWHNYEDLILSSWRASADALQEARPNCEERTKE